MSLTDGLTGAPPRAHFAQPADAGVLLISTSSQIKSSLQSRQGCKIVQLAGRANAAAAPTPPSPGRAPASMCHHPLPLLPFSRFLVSRPVALPLQVRPASGQWQRSSLWHDRANMSQRPSRRPLKKGAWHLGARRLARGLHGGDHAGAACPQASTLRRPAGSARTTSCSCARTGGMKTCRRSATSTPCWRREASLTPRALGAAQCSRR